MNPIACATTALSLSLTLLIALQSPALAEDEAELAGTWEAERIFGPAVQGELGIRKLKDAGWLAEIAGHRAAVRVEGKAVSFQLPEDLGRFRGEFTDNGRRIVGHWTQPNMVKTGRESMSPVVLEADADNRYSGIVKPMQDRYRLSIRIDQHDDGTNTAFMRNFERNLGLFLDLDHVEREGGSLRFMGHQFRNPELQVLFEGTYRSDFDLMTIFSPRMNGSYDLFRLADGEAGFSYPRDGRSETYEYVPPPALDDGWETGTLDEVGIDLGPIKAMIEEVLLRPAEDVHSPYPHGFLLARHGKLVAEEYFHGFNRSEPHDTRSASKSLTATLAGAMIEAGMPLDVDLPVYETLLGPDLPADLDPRKKRMRFENLLEMSSGYFCDDRNYDAPGNEEIMQEQTDEPDWYKYTLAVPMDSEPGTDNVYCSAAPNLAGAVMAKVANQPLETLFQRLIAEPLQIKEYHLILQPTGEPYMGGGIHWLPRDFMKLGQLMLNGGTWNGRRVVSEEWAARSTSPLVEIRGRNYGYLWWVTDYPYEGGTVRAFFAGGNGGQVVIGVPELDLLVAFYAGNYSDPVLYVFQNDLVPDYVLKAVQPE